MTYALLIGLGCTMTLAYSPFNLWPIALLCISLYVHILQSADSAKQAGKLGFAFGFGWFGVGISWVHVAIADFGGLPLIASLFLMLLLVAYLALFPALAGFISFKLKPHLSWFAIVPAWLFAEALRGWMLTGFPWLSVGYSQLTGPLSGFAPILGELGLQLIVLLIAALTMLTMRKALLSILSLTVLGFGLTSITWYQPTGERAKLALVQGNIEQSMKWQADNEMPTMLKYYEMTQPYLENTDLIIWPEAAVPRLEVLATEYLKEVDKVSAQANSAIVTGSVDYQPDTNFAFNNLLVLGKKYQDDKYGHYKYLDNNRYSKHHLLPIGEFVPFESVLRTLAPIFDLPMSSFSRGRFQQDNLIANDFRLSPAICFEIAFPEQIRANLYVDSDFILTVSNDAWFGNSHGPWQHLQIAQMRALEFATPVIRATNNGVTAVIGSDGNILAQLPQNQAAVLTHELDLVSSYTPFKRFGNALTWLSLIILSTLLWLMMRRKNSTD